MNIKYEIVCFNHPDRHTIMYNILCLKTLIMCMTLQNFAKNLSLRTVCRERTLFHETVVT